MWIIIERSKENPKDCWISGTFKNQSDAQDYFSKTQSTVTQELREIPAQDYPVIFVADLINPDYLYVTLEELAEKIFHFEREDDDHQYCIYFIFRDDYRTPILLTDHLGFIKHEHVDNHHIEGLIRKGLREEIDGPFVFFVFRCDNCGKRTPGILTEKGYEPPPGWQIIPSSEWDSYFSEIHLSKKLIPTYLTVCSENCKSQDGDLQGKI